MSRRPALAAASALVWLLVEGGASTAFAQPDGTDDESTCVTCHEAEEDEEMSRSVPEWRESVHAAHFVSCDACHGGDPSLEDADESMSEEAGFLDNPSWTEMADHCGACHEAIAASFESGSFGRLLREGRRVATCATCHMQEGHRIRAAVPADLMTAEACPSCPTVRDLEACMGMLVDVRVRARALVGAIDGVEAKGIELTDFRLGLEQVHAAFARSVHEFDDEGMGAARALAVTQVEGMSEKVAALDREADLRRRLGVGLLAALALLFAALWGTLRMHPEE